MQFFLPAPEDTDMAESTYASIRQFMVDQVGPLSDTRYFAIYYRHNGKDMVAKVGEPAPLTGELVCAIFRTAHQGGPFLVCTPNRGVIRGGPILASHDARAIEFEAPPAE